MSQEGHFVAAVHGDKIIDHMELILWRHAEAVDSYPDMDRALTTKGQKQAKKMAAWLKTRLPVDTRILASPAARTQQTVAALELDFTTLDELGPGASAQTILEAAGWPDAGGSVLIVGHQPTLGMAACFAMTGKREYWSVKKGAVWWITNPANSREEQSIIRAVISPDFI
jgi:phosphohistidine phosphatase